MGRRSTKTTKTGKFMNPTDQWRKQQRRKELKKNRKQRTVVREAVLRMKDPIVILQEIEEIEKAESELISASDAELLPNEKGLLEKKRKLHSNLDRIVKYWQKEDPKKAHDVKQLILDSEKKRMATTILYDSYKEARSQCEVSDIPLPESSDGSFIMPSDIPMPDELVPQPSHAPTTPRPPPGAPPSDLRGYNIVETVASQPKRSVRFAAADDAEEEDEEEEDEEGGEEESSEESDSEGEEFDPDNLPKPLQTKMAPPTLSQFPPPPPPGPPPLFAPRFPPPGVRLPPGPPPGLPPGLRPPPAFPPPRLPVPPSQPHIQSQAVLSSHPRPVPPTMGSVARGGKGEQGAVISAQPQLRNIQAEVTKFMPTSLRVRREVPRPSAGKVKAAKPSPQIIGGSGLVRRERVRGGGMQGDAYEAFMKEMDGIL